MTNQDDKKTIEQIKNSYVEQPNNKTGLNRLKDLDKKAKTPAYVFAYVYGVIGSLVLGLGMCFAMKVIGNVMALGIVIGVIGIAMVSTTYPLFVKILKTRKSKYAEQIINASDELLNN